MGGNPVTYRWILYGEQLPFQLAAGRKWLQNFPCNGFTSASYKTPKNLEIALKVLKKEGNRNFSRNTSFTSNVKDSKKNQMSENMARFFECWTWKFERSSFINCFLFTLFYMDTYIIKEIQKNLDFRFRSLIWEIFFLIKDAKRKQTFRYKFSSLKFVSLLIARSLFKSAYFRNCR